MGDPADLSRLSDIVVPSPVPWWPLAPGWWILGAALLAFMAILVVVAANRYRSDAYRRAALAQLASIGTVTDPASAAAVSAVLKRVALVAYPRTEVASLTGSMWSAFLDRAAATTDFTSGPAAGLGRAALGGPVGDGAAIVAAARRWVRQHRRAA